MSRTSSKLSAVTIIVVGIASMVIAVVVYLSFGSSESSRTSRVATEPERSLQRRVDAAPRSEAAAGEAVESVSESSDEQTPPRFLVTTTQEQDRLAKQTRSIEPSHDGWKTEQLAARAQSTLTRMLNHVIQHGQLSDQDSSNDVTNDFACAPLRPEKLVEVFRDATVSVSRGDAARMSQTRPSYQGVKGLATAMRTLLEPLKSQADDKNPRVDVKIHQVTVQEPMMATTVDVELRRTASHPLGEIHTVWECLWELGANDHLRLSALRVRDYEQSMTPADSSIWFADCTESVLKRNPSFSSQLAFGLDYWLQRIERVHRMHVFAANGLAIGDANGDGLDDLYVCQPGGLPNRLFVQDVDGSATDRSSRARVDWLDATSSALFIDLDNDNDQDLVTATLSGVLVMENDSTGRFKIQGILPTAGADMQSLSAADYDNDGDLDIYVCLNFPKVTSETSDQHSPFVYHDANDGAPNRLFRNDIVPGEEWEFADVTRSSGMDENNRRHSLAASWEDFDNDGDQDLYVANDYGRNCLYRNDQGKFVNVARDAGVVDFGSGMSVSWADFNHDGRMDLYVGNMYSSAGNRITTQKQFRPNDNESIRNVLRRFAKGNSLFANLGDGKFREIGAPAAVEHARWAWSSIFADVNNSGQEDLFVANGYITADDTEDL